MATASTVEFADKKTSGKTEHLCESCERDDESTPARFWCKQCQEGLCDNCKKYHRRMKNYESHEVVSRIDIEQVTAETRDSDETCNDHEGEVLSDYCLDHQKLCCKLCLLFRHRSCTQIRTLDEMAKNTKIKSNVKQIVNELNDFDIETKLLSQEQKTNIDLLDSNRDRMKDKISKMVDDGKVKLDECHLNFNCRLDKIHQQKKMEIVEKEESIESFRKTLSTARKRLDVASKDENEKQIFVMVEKIRYQMLRDARKLNSVMVEDKHVDLKLVFDETFNKVCDVKSVGVLELAETPRDPSFLPFMTAVESFPTCLGKAPCIEQIRMIKMFEIQSDNLSLFYGGVFLNDGSLLLAAYNKKLKLYDASGAFKYEHELNFTPFDVALSESVNRIFVSDRNSAFIRSYVVAQNSLVECGSITVRNAVYGIDTLGEKILCSDTEKIELLDNGGNVLANLTRRSNTHICASKIEKKLFYGCSNEVICESLDGNKLFRYSHPQLTYPRGIALDIHENLFVCGEQSGNIHVISKDGKQNVIFISSKLGRITRPSGIGFDRTGKRLFVTSCQYDQPVEVYELTYSQV